MRQLFTLISCLVLLVACDQQEPQAEQTSMEVTAPTGSHLMACPNLSKELPEAQAFLGRLNTAIKNKDVAFISDLVDEDIKFSFGDEGGKAAFLNQWEFKHNAEGTEFWPTIRTMLDLGGYVQRNDAGAVSAIVFPCTFHELPADNWLVMENPTLSAFDYNVAIKPTPLTDAEGNTQRMLERGEVVALSKNLEGTIRTYDGLEGQADAAALRSPVDYRMFLTPSDGAWKLTLFIAGD